jgi:hypothetical protein
LTLAVAYSPRSNCIKVMPLEVIHCLKAQ